MLSYQLLNKIRHRLSPNLEWFNFLKRKNVIILAAKQLIVN